MPRTNLPSRRPSRTSCSLLALATVMAVGATPAAAQSLLGTGTYVTNPNATGITTGVGTTTVNLNGGQTVIDWTPTDNATGTGTNINFQNAGTTALFTGSADFAVLNRVLPADISRAIVMNGIVNSRVGGSQRGSVYFYSPSGFIFGGSSVFSVGSLVVTASPITVDGNGNFINGSTVVFGQAPNANAAIVSGGTINASSAPIGIIPPGQSYVAMVAPKVVHSGAITVNGSAALVGAEAATINFSPDGLFDIQVTVGSTSTSGVEVYGDIGGPAPANGSDNQRVYLVAVPKNDAMTLVIGSGADLGFTLANNATVDDAGAIVLSAGHDIVDGQIGSRSAGHGATATGNFWFTGAHAINNLFGEATGYADLYSLTGSQATTIFDNDVTVHAAGPITMNASGVGASLSVAGNLGLSTDVTGAAGQSVTAANVNLYSLNSALVSVAGTTTLSADATGGPASSGSAGSGAGGTVWVYADDGGSMSLQSLSASAIGAGGAGLATGVNAGNGTGGTIRLYADDTASTAVNGAVSFEAKGTGGDASGAGLAGTGQGGNAYVYVGDNAAVTIHGATTLNSEGQGGTHASGNGGAGTGGESRFSSVVESLTNGLLTLNGNVELSSDGTGGASGGAGSGGTGTGGWARISTPLGSSVDLNGSANLHATGTGGVSTTGTGGAGQGGTAEIAGLVGNIDISGTVTVDGSGQGGDGNVGGAGNGGNANVQSSSDVSLPGQVYVYADGTGGTGFNGDGGDGSGGSIDVEALAGGDLGIGYLYVSAGGRGGDSGAVGFTSGDGFGGDIDIRAFSTGAFMLNGDLYANADGSGGYTWSVGVNGGNGSGGAIELAAIGTDASLEVGGDVFLSANGEAGSGGECIACGGLGGDGFGGDIDVAASGTNGSLLVSGGLSAYANGYGGIGVDAHGGDGEGGTIQMRAYDGGELTVTDGLLASADGHGGWREDGDAGSEADAFAGDGVGGFVELFTYGSGTPDINLLSSMDIHADGYGGGTNVSGVNAFAGSGTGGIARLDAQAGTIDITGNAIVTATGEGGDATFGTGGDGSGRNAEIAGIGGAVTIGGTALVDASGRGGNGLTGGAGTGGGDVDDNAAFTDGAIILAQRGSVSIAGAATVNALGVGGNGLAGDFSSVGGNGGNATGGVAAVIARNSDSAPSNITLSTLNISASATGGSGGLGGSGNLGGNGGNGGDAMGGGVYVYAYAGNGHLAVTSVNATATATGGQGGGGGNGDGQSGGNGGAGGDAEGGAVSIGTASGSAEATGSNLGTATYGTVHADASATGGDGGAGNFGATDGNGGAGGTGDGGSATLLVRGSTVTVTGTTTLTASGTGGDGGSGGGATGLQGAGANGFAGEVNVLASSRFLFPTQRATLNAGAIIGTATGAGGFGSTNGTGIVEGGSGFVVDSTTANIGSLNFTISGDTVDPSADESRIAITNSTVTATGTFGFATDGDLSFYINNGSLTAGTLALSAGNFVTDTLNAAPTLRGTATANSALVTSAGDFIADANFDVTNTFLVDVPGLIRVGNVADDNGVDFSAGGSMSIDAINAGTYVDLFAGGSIDTDAIVAGSSVAIASTDGSISVGNISAGGNVALAAETFIAGGNIAAGGNISAQTATGDIGLANLTSTFGFITLDAGGDILLSGDALADGVIQLTADGNILINNATAHESVDISSGGLVDAASLTAGDTVGIEAFGSVTAGNISAGLVNPSSNLNAEHSVAIHAGGNIVTGNIDAADRIGLATPGTMTIGDIDAGGIFMALGHGDMSFGDATASEVFLADYVLAAPGSSMSGTCVGACGTAGPNGSVTAPPGGSSYSYVTTEGGVAGAGEIPGEGGTTGSLFTTSAFDAAAGDALDFWFNYVTSDGSGFADYAWAGLFTTAFDPVAILFTARTQPEGTIVPGQNLPGVEATLTPSSVPIIPGAPAWDALGTSSGSCYAAGCGLTGWINSNYQIAEAGTYVLRFGVINWSDSSFQSGLAFSGITVGGVPVTPTAARTGGSISIGDVTTGKFTAAAGTSLTTGIIDSSGSIGLDAGGAITTANLFAGDFVLANGGSILTANIEANSVDMTSTGGTLATGAIQSGDFVELHSAGDMQTAAITAGTNLNAESGAGMSLGVLQAGGDITLDAIGNAAFVSAVAGDEFDFSTGGSLTGGNVVAGNEIGGEAGGSVTLGNLTAGLPVDSDFSVGILAAGNIGVGNVNAAGPAGFATSANLTTGNIAAGEGLLALVGGNMTTGAITTSGEGGGQIYIGDDSMFFAAGGTPDGEGDFDASLVLGQTPVATGGSISINGPVNTGLFRAAAGTTLLTQAITAGEIDARALGTAAINGLWSAPLVTLASNDINITATGGIAAGAAGEVNLMSSNSGGMLIGDGLTGTGYALSNAEFSRISGGDINLVAGAFPGAAAGTRVGNLTITAGAAGNIRSADGGLAIVGLNEAGTERDGSIRVVGNVAGTGFTSTNYLAFGTETFELDAATGSIALTSSGSTLSGELALFADRIHVASGAILDQLANNPTYSGYQQDLNEAAAVQRPEGVLRAGSLWIESDNLHDVLIQNTGTTATPAGFLVNEAFINDDAAVAGPPGSINLVVNGQVVTDTGTLTGIAARDELTAEADLSPFTANSTINGCPLTGACIIQPEIEQPPSVVDDQINLIGFNPFGDSLFDDTQEGDAGSSNPITPPQPLFDTRPLNPSSDVNDPVSGTGNPSLIAGDDCKKDEESQSQCATEKEEGQ